MTAEIAIMNTVGVALAADSAVTVGHRNEKIYTSADKLFQLSEVDPIGIMVYGGADFVGVPWETIIKSYRLAQGHKSLGSVKEHTHAFFRYLANNRGLFPIANQQDRAQDLVAVLWASVLNDIKKKIDSEAEKKGGVDAHEVTAICTTIVSKWMKEIRSQKRLEGFTDAVCKRMRKRSMARLRSLRSKIFGNLPLSRRTYKNLIELAFFMLERALSPMKSGIVFAGFGALEYLPSFYAYNIEGMIENKPRFSENVAETITIRASAVVSPFAQQEVVCLFMEGVDPELLKYMKGSTKKLFEAAFDTILKNIEKNNVIKSSTLARLKRELIKLPDEMFLDWKAVQKEYWGPVMSNIDVLPKNELAAMAEAFVNLTKFRRHVTTDQETVGGPIDVAVITKGDGFVWVRRKHYFAPDLNPRFLTRYK